MSRQSIPALLRHCGLATLILLACSDCGSDAVAGPDATIVSVTISPASAIVRLGATSQLAVTGLNAANAVVTATPVFTSSDASVVQISQSGLARALKIGSATVTAKIGAAEKSAAITVVAGFPAALTKVSGDNLNATIQSATSAAPSVAVKDSVGNAVQGATVTFSIATGGGSIAGASATSDANGVATAGTWTLGSSAGANTLTASVQGATAPVTATFSATAIALVPTRLGLVTSPTSAVSGVALDPQPVVEIRNAAGSVVPTATGTVTMSVVASGGLLGTTTVNAVAGVARFTNVAFGFAGTQTVRSRRPDLTRYPQASWSRKARS